MHNPPDVHLPRILCWIFASLNLRLSILLRHQAHFEARTLNAAAGHVMLAAVRTRQRAQERDTVNRERAWQGVAEVSAAHLQLVCCRRGATKLLVLRYCLSCNSLGTMDVIGDKERACDEAYIAQVRSRVIGYEAGYTWRRVVVNRGETRCRRTCTKDSSRERLDSHFTTRRPSALSKTRTSLRVRDCMRVPTVCAQRVRDGTFL